MSSFLTAHHDIIAEVIKTKAHAIAWALSVLFVFSNWIGILKAFSIWGDRLFYILIHILTFVALFSGGLLHFIGEDYE